MKVHRERRPRVYDGQNFDLRVSRLAGSDFLCCRALCLVHRSQAGLSRMYLHYSGTREARAWAAMSSQESQLGSVMAKDICRRRPESSRVLVRTTFWTLTAVVIGHAQMLYHRVMPLDKLLREVARLERADTITKNPVHVHVTPIL